MLRNLLHIYSSVCFMLCLSGCFRYINFIQPRPGCNRLVVFSEYSIQYYMIKFVSDLRQVCGFPWLFYGLIYNKVCLCLGMSMTCGRLMVSPCFPLHYYLIEFVCDLVCFLLLLCTCTILYDKVCQ